MPEVHNGQHSIAKVACEQHPPDDSTSDETYDRFIDARLRERA